MTLKPPASPNDPLNDGRMFFNVVTEYGAQGAEGSGDTGLIQRALDDAGDVGGIVLIPAGTYLITEPLRVPSNVRIQGAGRGVTTLKSSSSFIANGPVIANTLDADGFEITMTDVQIVDLTIDGDYTSNAQYNQQATTTSTITSTDTNFSVTFTEDLVAVGWASSGRIALVDAIGDNSGLITYTSMTGTHQIDGCEFVDSSSSGGFSAAIGTDFRSYSESAQGLVRMKTYERLVIDRVEVKNALGYCIGLQGQPEESTNYTDGTWPKDNLTIRDSAVRNSFNSDGIDIKEQYGVTLINVEATDNHDKGINIRGRYQMFVNCRTSGNGTGFGSTSNRYQDDEPTTTLTIAATATDTTLTVADTTNFPASGSGYVGCERISWTGKTATTLTGVSRALEDTRPTTHQASGTSTKPVWADVAGADLIDASVTMIGCWSLGDIGTGISVIAGGAGTTMRVDIHGGGAFGSNRGLLVKSSRGVTHARVFGGDYHDNGEGIRFEHVHVGRIYGTSLRGNNSDDFPNALGDGIYLLNTSNGVVLHDLDVAGNQGYGLHFPANGNGDYTRVEGGRWRNNTLGNVNTPPITTLHNSGPIFGDPTRGLQFAVPSLTCSQAATAVAANAAKMVRFVAPYDMTVGNLAYEVTTAAGSDDAVDVGIYDQTYIRLGSSGATTGKLNSTGVKTVPLTASVTIARGGIYYVGLSCGAIGTTAAQIRMTSLSTVTGDLLGGGTGNREQFSMAAAHPLPTPLVASATGTAPIMAVKA